MRVTFVPPSEEEFKKLFLSTPLRKGGGFEDISVFYPSNRKGGGILSIMSGMARKVLPFIFKAVNPSAKEFGKAVLTDMISEERPLKESLRKHGTQAVKSTGLRLLKGSGKRARMIQKQKKTRRDKHRLNKEDVYNLLQSFGRGTS